MSEIVFPLIYTDDEGTDHRVASLEELSLVAEFVDDKDPIYGCRDSLGRRVRLIVWALEVLVIQLVPDEFDPHQLVVCSSKEEQSVLVETFNRISLRALRTAPGEVATTLDPEAWSASAKSSVSAGEFHDLWMRARVGKRY
ncbi:hypothetical protein ABCR94_12005 [Streptomyces sp. 21So2-11]|uniref:hypothetical protein n=1 Tax=Streptomyces sp. 21So2-11 TaxID=3144408 RepID=UPI00321AD898